MRSNEQNIIQLQTVKRVRIRQHYSHITVRANRSHEWLAACGFMAAIAAVLSLIAYFSYVGFDPVILVVLGGTLAIPCCLVFLCYLAWGWRITLDPNNDECRYARTYAWWETRSRCFPLSSGCIGPGSVRMQWSEKKQTAYSWMGCLVLMVLGPVGVVIGIVAHYLTPVVDRVAEYPTIVYYDEILDRATTLIILSNQADRDRILGVFAELAPNSVSTQ